MPTNNSDLIQQMWFFTGGSILVLIQSLVNGVKRRWFSLLAGCLFGGVGSVLAAYIWGDSKYIYIICGVAAVMTENLLAGALTASKEFADSPIKVLTHLAKVFLPTFGKTTGDGSSTSTDDLK